MKFAGFVGGGYKLDSVNVDCQRCVNLYPEIIESGTGKGGDIAYLKSTPGLRKLLEIGTGGNRLKHVDSEGRIFTVVGNQLFILTFDGTSWAATIRGTLDTVSGPVKAASARIGDDWVTIFVDGTSNYLFYRTTFGTPGMYFGKFADFGFPGVPGATHIEYIDGYFIFNDKGTNQIYTTDWNSINVDPLNYASAEGDPDNIVGLISTNRNLVLGNEKSTELYYDSGNADFPFERVSGGFIEKGVLAGHTMAKIEGIYFYLGRDISGQGIVYAAQGLSPQRISTHAIESAIAKYASPSSATAYTYQMGGHQFYVLNFAEATWVYDLQTKLWHERAATVAGELRRHRGETHVFVAQYNVHLIGDFENGNIYQLDETYFKDGDLPITRMRVSPHVSNGKNKIFYNTFTLDMETGIGLDGDVLGSDPQVIMTYSDDSGRTYSSEDYQSAGRSAGGIGEFRKLVEWRRLGASRDRVFKTVITDPVRVTFIGADLGIEQGMN